MARTKTKKSSPADARAVNRQVVRLVGLAAALLLLGQALVLWLVGTGGRLPVHVAYATSDSLMSKLTNARVSAPAAHQVASISVTVLLIVLLALTGVLLALQSMGLISRMLRGRVSEQRATWMIIALATAGLLLATDLLAGDYDLRNLIIVALVGFGATVAGLHATMFGGKRRVMYLAIAAVPWLWVLWTLGASSLYGTMQSLGAVWWLLLTGVVGLKLIGLHLWLVQRGYKQWRNGTLAAVGLYVLLLIAESAFVWQVFAAFLHG